MTERNRSSERTQDPNGLLADWDPGRLLRVLLERAQRHGQVLRKGPHSNVSFPFVADHTRKTTSQSFQSVQLP